MSDQLPEITNHDPMAKYGQDLLYFPNATTEITSQLVDELTCKHQQSPSNTPEQVAAHVKRDVMRTFIGTVATVVYADLAEQLVPHIRQNRPLATEQIPRSHLYAHAGLPKYSGSAEDFAQTGMAWLFGAASRIHRRAENPNDRYHPLVKALAETTRDSFLYIAEDVPNRKIWKKDIPNIQARLERAARHAPTNFAYKNLLDNVKVTLELLLHFGLAYSREEGIFPDGDLLTAAALGNASMMGRAATIGTKAFVPMAHANPLATTFHHYELTELADVNDLYPQRESIFTRKDGEFTFRYPPIAKGPKKRPRNCPAARAWRPPEARGQDAIEELFVCAEEYSGRSIPRPGDGTYQTATRALLFGSFIGKGTIYAAWPQKCE